MIIQLIASFFVALVVSVGAGYIFIPMLRRLKAGQSIQQDGPVWHSGKQGTPTMGGIIFISGIIIACLTVGISETSKGNHKHLFLLLFALVYALIGFLDDFEKLKKKQNLGLTALQKFSMQLIVAVAFVVILHVTGSLTTDVYVPFFNTSFYIPAYLYYVFAAFVIVGTVNAVNITDGTDGLSTGVTIPVVIVFALIALLWGDAESGIFAAAIAGGLVGFLLFNFYPAKVFMGDTGSLFLGGVVCAIAFSMDIPLVLITLGIVYFVETLSVIIQVSYFKLSKGSRVFKMAPIHHHFEMCGWNEYKVFTVFTTVSTIFAVISFFGVFLRYKQ